MIQTEDKTDSIPQKHDDSHPSFLAWLPQLRREIWILAGGQLLLYIGQGFTLVYSSIYFVNQLGFSPTQVGLALSSGGLSGIAGRFWAGNAIGSERWGRKGTLILASLIPALACFCLAYANTFSLLVLGNLLLGLGLSLYWPANLSVTTDLTTPENRTEAFALTRLVDNLGLGLGALLAGQYVAMSGNYSLLFIIKGITYCAFGGVVYLLIDETRPAPSALPEGEADELVETQQPIKIWLEALGDRTLVIYLMANLFFAMFGAQHTTTLPLYLANFVPAGNTDLGFSEQWISYFFAWHACLKIVFQLPVTRSVKAISHVSVMLMALIIWCGAFAMIWGTGLVSAYAWRFAAGAFTLMGLAEMLYSPAAVSLVGDIAPERLRGIYFALESQCWGIGLLVGPAMGGWALDHPETLGANFWLALVASGGLAGGILLGLRRRMAGGEAACSREAAMVMDAGGDGLGGE